MKAEHFEGHVQVLILIAVAGMAGAGSFTHVHDWTMSVVPAHTGSWLGWVNAVITELVPAAAGIEIRRRKRQQRPVTYPMTILVTDAVISIGVQLSDAKHDFGGSLAFALPALAFLALTKLVLSRARTATEQEDPACAPSAGTSGASPPPLSQATTAPATATGPTSQTAPSWDNASLTAAPALTASATSAARSPFNSLRELTPVPSDQLQMSAGMIAFNHEQATGQPITPGELAERLNVPRAYAESLLDHLGDSSPVTAVNGTGLAGR